MSIFQFLRDEVGNVSSTVSQQQQGASQILDTLKAVVPTVKEAWIGGDFEAFESDVLTILVPAMTELILAIAGINVNLTSATGVVDQADQKCQGMANQLGDLFGQI
jgi:WXG100 family type VII secretion target